MSKVTERVFIRNARLSFPALDEPRASMAGVNDDPKYQATFLLEPNNPSVALIQQAIAKVATAEWGPRASAIMNNPDKVPLKRGDDREKVPEGYAGMLYVAARSKNAPELRDANPRIIITDKQTIREKFVAGYRVNGYVDIYPYNVKNAQGTTIKSGIGCGLVSVQFVAYADAFSGVTKPTENDYPDCSAEAEASGAYGAPVAPAPVAPTQPQPDYWYPQGAQPAPAINSGEDIPF